jgi:chitin disaccharide deacetylase
MNAAIEIIINADDFGYSAPVNEAIVKSFRQLLINSTSLMANMPGFEDAINQLRTNPFLSNRVGLHLNLTEGYPLSEEIKKCPRFCDASGAFVYKRRHPLFFLTAIEQKALYEEMKAQMEKMISAGIYPTHLDSHHHVHTEWAIVKLATRLGRVYGVPRIRLTRNMGRQEGYSRTIYKRILNRWLKRLAGITSTDYFGDTDDLSFLMRTKPPAGKSIEIMVHPKLNERGELVDYDQQDLQRKLIPIINDRNTISYTNI